VEVKQIKKKVIQKKKSDLPEPIMPKTFSKTQTDSSPSSDIDSSINAAE